MLEYSKYNKQTKYALALSQVARSSKESATPRAGAVDFGRLLQEWVDGGGRPLSVRESKGGVGGWGV